MEEIGRESVCERKLGKINAVNILCGGKNEQLLAFRDEARGDHRLIEQVVRQLLAMRGIVNVQLLDAVGRGQHAESVVSGQGASKQGEEASAVGDPIDGCIVIIAAN